MAENAYDFVLKRYAMRRVARAFEEICKQVVERASRDQDPSQPAACLALAD